MELAPQFSIEERPMASREYLPPSTRVHAIGSLAY